MANSALEITLRSERREPVRTYTAIIRWTCCILIYVNHAVSCDQKRARTSTWTQSCYNKSRLTATSKELVTCWIRTTVVCHKHEPPGQASGITRNSGLVSCLDAAVWLAAVLVAHCFVIVWNRNNIYLGTRAVCSQANCIWCIEFTFAYIYTLFVFEPPAHLLNELCALSTRIEGFKVRDLPELKNATKPECTPRRRSLKCERRLRLRDRRPFGSKFLRFP